MRVHEIARQAGVSSKEVRAFLAGTLGVSTKSPSSAVPPLFGLLVAETLAYKQDAGFQET